MLETNTIKLKYSSILNVPFQFYDSFTFIVNNQRFQTNRLVSDLLSPKICLIHSTDPTFDTFTINTQNQGNFSHILELCNFNNFNIPISEVEFFVEVIDILGNDSFEISTSNESNQITIDTVFQTIQKHIKFSNFFSKQINDEIDFISSHFYEIYDTKKEELFNLEEDTLFSIINNKKLQLKDEDQLMEFINEIYKQNQNKDTAKMYENVIFLNVTSKTMNQFIEQFDFNDISADIWSSLSLRLQQDIVNNDQTKSGRYLQKKEKVTSIQYQSGHESEGIIHYLSQKTGGNLIDNGTVEITSNSVNSNESLRNLLDFINNNCYATSTVNALNAWICFEFKNIEIEVTNYTIKTHSSPGYPKNWVIETSNDGESWQTIDQHQDENGLNAPNTIKTFNVKPNNFSRFVRFRNTGEYRDCNIYFLRISFFEFFGRFRDSKISQ